MAKLLKDFQGRSLSLNGITTLDDQLLEALQSSFSKKGAKRFLSLDGLTTLTPHQAKVLAGFEGATLSLNGIKHLSKEALAALVSYSGNLLLDRFQGESLAQLLSSFRGERLSLRHL